MTIPNNPIVNAGLLYVNGLQIVYLNSKQITLQSGAARDINNIDDIILSSNIILDGTHVGTNGVDISPLGASTFYGVYVIGDSTDHKPTAGLFSAQNTAINSAPFLPVGYDMYRRVGFILTDSSANISVFSQMGSNEIRKYYYVTPINILTNGNSTTFVNVTASAAVPLKSGSQNQHTEAVLNLNYTPSSAGNSAQFQISNTLGVSPVLQFGCGVAAPQFGTLTVPTNTIFQFITYKVFAGDTLTVNVSGYTDYL